MIHQQYDSPKILALDFDQYQRYRCASELLRDMLGEKAEHAGKPFRLLEVGSNVINLFPDFLSDTGVEVTRCDTVPLAKPDPNFVHLKLGVPLPFEDGSFDAVVALEVLEHMPKDERPGFICDCLRVSSKCFVFSAPRGSAEVSAAEVSLHDLILRHYGARLPFLEEHKQFGLPKSDEIRPIVEATGLPWHGRENSPLDCWLSVSWLSHFILGIEGSLEEGAVWLNRFNQYFNGNSYLSAPNCVCYRVVWAVAKDPALHVSLPPYFREKQLWITPTPDVDVRENALNGLVKLTGRYHRDMQGLLIRETTGLGAEIKQLKFQIQHTDNLIQRKETELTQLSRQFQSAQSTLDHVLHSRTWRYTQWIRDIKNMTRRGNLRIFASRPFKPGIPVRFYMRIEAPEWCALTVRVGTHGKPAAGQLQLRILDESGKQLRTSHIRLDSVRDNSSAVFGFPKLPGAGAFFVFEFVLNDASGKTLLSLYEADNRGKALKAAQKLLGRRERCLLAVIGMEPVPLADSDMAAADESPAELEVQAAQFTTLDVAGTAKLPTPNILPAAGRADLTVLFPAIRSISFSGGPNTAFILCALLARRGLRINAVSLNIPLESEEVAQRHVAALVNDDSVLDNIRFTCGQKNPPTSLLGANDMLMATAWWTAVRARQLMTSMRRDKFFYLIQDFEPLFYAWSPEHVAAMETYSYPMIPIINERMLADYFAATKAGRFADDAFRNEAMVFQPAVDRNRFFPAAARPGKKQILFYARPSAPRNLYHMGMEAMQLLVSEGTISAAEWEIRLMGDTIEPTDLGHGMVVRSLPWMDYDSYARNMRKATVGLSLMVSPHTSYPPLEMAASGVKVVTNVYANKNAAELEALSKNIVSSEPSVPLLVHALQRAIRESADRPAVLAASDIVLPRSWESVFEPVLDRIIREVEKGVSKPIARTIFLPTNTYGRARATAELYPAWRRARQGARQEMYRTQLTEPLFSVQTTVYDTPAYLLFELQRSLSAQDYPHFEWNILDNGSTKPEVIQAIGTLGRMDSRFRVWRVLENLHIIGGNHFLLKKARNPYIIPVDGDDLLAPDALRILAHQIDQHGRPKLMYSDEEKTDVEGRPHEPILRHAPSILTGFSHCFYSHLACIDRATALEAGVYTEEYARGSHDWDTWFRLHEKGVRAVHVPEILYGWRMSPDSTAANTGNKDYVINSQRQVLENALLRRGLKERFDVLPDEDMGTCYWVWNRRPIDAPRVHVFFHAHTDAARASKALATILESVKDFPRESLGLTIICRLPDWTPGVEFNGRAIDVIAAAGKSEKDAVNDALKVSAAELLVVIDEHVCPERPDWLWRVAGLFELDPQLAIASGLVVNAEGKAVCTARIGGLSGEAAMPMIGLGLPDVYHHGRRYLLDGNCSFLAMPWVALRRAVFQEVGGFNMDFGGNNPGSLELCARVRRAGHSCGFAGRIVFRSLNPKMTYALDLQATETQSVLAGIKDLIRDDPYYHPFKSLDLQRFNQLTSAEDRAAILSQHMTLPESARIEPRADGAPTARFDLSTRGLSQRVETTVAEAFCDPLALPSNFTPFMKRRLEIRRALYSVKPQPGLLSMVTSAYNTPAIYLNILAQSLLTQDYPDFEWVLVDNGSTDPETLWLLKRLSGIPQVKFVRLEKNQGILGGMRCGLEHATGRYILPLDSDDFLYPDALRIMAWQIESSKYPALLYSDEDLLVEDTFQAPYLKPDWDPVLFANSCYIAHLCAIDRNLAMKYALYTEGQAQGCHDWHSFMTLWLNGHTPVHVPEVLYSWRVHGGSCAGDINSKSYITDSHRKVLGMFIEAATHPERYRLDFNPLFNAKVDFVIKREHVSPRPIHTVVWGDQARAVDLAPHRVASTHATAIARSRDGLANLLRIARSEAANGGLIHLVHESVLTQGSEWPWEAIALMELHPDTVTIAGRVISPSQKVLAAGAYFGVDGVCGCPDLGRSASESGYFVQMWKQRSVSAAMSTLMIADAGFLAAFLEQAPDAMTIDTLGAWAGAYARQQKRRTIYTPLLCGKSRSETAGERPLTDGERAAFNERYRELIPERLLLGPSVSLDPARRYAPDAERADQDRPC